MIILPTQAVLPSSDQLQEDAGLPLWPLFFNIQTYTDSAAANSQALVIGICASSQRQAIIGGNAVKNGQQVNEFSKTVPSKAAVSRVRYRRAHLTIMLNDNQPSQP
jgi:hypothetical protein